MADIIDEASKRTAEILNDALEAHYRNREEIVEPWQDECAVCGEPIPLERRRANPTAIRCVDCQRDHDRWLRQWA